MARGDETREGRPVEMQAESQPPTFDPEAIFAILKRHRVAFVLIGAFGATTQGWSEPTSDVDITPEREVQNIQRLVKALEEADAKPLTSTGEIDSWPIDDQQLRMRETAYFSTRHGDIDVVTNPAGASGYPDLARPSESLVVSIGKTQVRVARLERIIESKRASDRPKDRDAVPRLERLLDENRERET